MKKILPAVLLASTLIINHSYAMEMGDDAVLQGLKAKMNPILLEIYQKPKDARKAYVDQVGPTLSEADAEDIIDFITNTHTENKYNEITRNIEDLRFRNESLIPMINNSSDDLSKRDIHQAHTEQSIKDFLIQAENHACSFDPSASQEQKDQLKTAFMKYLEDDYTLKSQKGKIPTPQGDEGYKIFDSFLSNVCNILNSDRTTIILNEAIRESENFSLQYFIVKEQNKGALEQCNFTQGFINERENEIINLKNDLRKLETPLYLFMDDLESIFRLF